MKKSLKVIFVSLMVAMLFVSCASNGKSSKEYSYTEKTIYIDVPAQDGISAHTIPGILTIPNVDKGTKLPSMVMLHCTASNMHEAGGGYDIAAPILAKSGIATLRIDFMGSGEATSSYTEYCYTSANIDAKAAADYLLSLDCIDKKRMGVMGWSQGATNALLVAAKYPSLFNCVVSWSGCLYLDKCKGVFVDFDKSYEEAKKNGSAEMPFDWRDSLYVGQRWFDEVKNTDMISVIKKVQCPVLAICGDLDTVVPHSESVSIANETKNGSLYTMKGADHLFNILSGDTSKVEEATLRTISFINQF